MPPGLDLPPLPRAFERAMRLWGDLHRHRQTGMGIGNITWPDIAAYQEVTGEVLSRSDIEALEIVDGEFHASRAAAEEWRTKAAERRRG